MFEKEDMETASKGRHKEKQTNNKNRSQRAATSFWQLLCCRQHLQGSIWTQFRVGSFRPIILFLGNVTCTGRKLFSQTTQFMFPFFWMAFLCVHIPDPRFPDYGKVELVFSEGPERIPGRFLTLHLLQNIVTWRPVLEKQSFLHFTPLCRPVPCSSPYAPWWEGMWNATEGKCSVKCVLTEVKKHSMCCPRAPQEGNYVVCVCVCVCVYLLVHLLNTFLDKKIYNILCDCNILKDLYTDLFWFYISNHGCPPKIWFRFYYNHENKYIPVYIVNSLQKWQI